MSSKPSIEERRSINRGIIQQWNQVYRTESEISESTIQKTIHFSLSISYNTDTKTDTPRIVNPEKGILVSSRGLKHSRPLTPTYVSAFSPYVKPVYSTIEEPTDDDMIDGEIVDEMIAKADDDIKADDNLRALPIAENITSITIKENYGSISTTEPTPRVAMESRKIRSLGLKVAIVAAFVLFVGGVSLLRSKYP